MGGGMTVEPFTVQTRTRRGGSRSRTQPDDFLGNFSVADHAGPGGGPAPRAATGRLPVRPGIGRHCRLRADRRGQARLLVRGQPVGEIAAGDDPSATPTCSAVIPIAAGSRRVTPVTAWQIDAADLDRLLVDAPTFARALARDLGRRLRAAELSLATGISVLLRDGGTCWSGAARSSTGRAHRRATRDVRIRDGAIAEVGAGARTRRRDGRRRRRRVRRARVHRLPHALRPVGVVGPAGRPDAAARRDHGRHRQLLAVAHARCAPPTAWRQRRVRLHRGHPGRRVRDRDPVDVGVVRRVARRAAGARHRGERRRAPRPLEPARLRDGRRGVGPRRDGPRSATRLAAVLADSLAAGRARPVDVVHRPGPPRARGAEPRRRRRRAPRAHRGARPRAGARTRARVPARGSRRSTANCVDIDRVARWCGAAGVACTWNQLAENSRDPSRAERIIEQAHVLHADGCRVYAQVSPRPFNLNVSFDQTPAFVADPRVGSAHRAATPDEKRAHARRRRVAGAGPRRLGPRRRRLHHLPGVAPRPRAPHVGARRRGALPRRHVRRRGRGARWPPVGRARRLGARARPRAGHGGGSAVEQRRGQGVGAHRSTRRPWWVRATPARTCR